MINISTGGIGPMDVTTGTRAKGKSKEEKTVDAFANLMNMVSSRQEQCDSIFANECTDVTDSVVKGDSLDCEEYKKQENVELSKDSIQNTEKTSTNKDTQVGESKEMDENVEQDNDKLDDAVALIKEVKNAIKDALGVSEEELDKLLEDFGTSILDLMLGDSLKNFILQVQGATNVDLLVNENLANMVDKLMVEVTQLIDGFSIDNDINFQQFVEDNLETLEAKLNSNYENVDINIDDAWVVEVSDKEIVSNDVSVEKIDIQETENVDYKVDDESSLNKDVPHNEDAETSDKTVVDNFVKDGQGTHQETSSEQNNQHIITNLNHVVDNTLNSSVAVNDTVFFGDIQEADIIRQIIDQIKVNVGKEVQSMEVQLNPENLGKVYVNVEAKDGVMQAKIIAETEAAKNAIENNLAVLKENFSNNELKVETIEVMVATYGFFEDRQNGDFDNQEQANDASRTFAGINVNDLDEELTDEEELEVEIMKSKGNTVSYTV